MNRPSITALLLTAALPAAIAASAPTALAQSPCNSFSYGIGNCANEGNFRPTNRNNSGYGSGSNGGSYQPTLLEQPRFQPGFGSGYNYNNSPRYGW